MKDYSHLKIDPSAYCPYGSPGLTNWLIHKIANMPGAASVSAKALRFFQGIHYVSESNKKMQKVKAQLSSDEKTLGKANQFGSQFGYEDPWDELKTALVYKKQIYNNKASYESESGALYKEAPAIFSRLFKKDPSIKRVLNFGVSYGYLDSLLAKANPQVEFMGIDRSTMTKFVNDEEFGNIPNLKFHAGDVFDLLKNERFEGGVFVHARTLILLPQAFVEKLYKAVYEAGFKYIVCLEQVGIPRTTGKPFPFSEEPLPSMAWRDNLFLHNYPWLLVKAGFTIEESALIKTDHPHADVHILHITAVKNS